MALHYQTECRMGTRRINRSYSGYQAFFAIVFDLFFGLLFELVASLLSLLVSARLLLDSTRGSDFEALVEGAGRGHGDTGLRADTSVRDRASRDRPACASRPALAARGVCSARSEAGLGVQPRGLKQKLAMGRRLRHRLTRSFCVIV